MTDPAMRLDLFGNDDFERGASRITELAWLALEAVLFSSWLPGSHWRCALLRMFGARIGTGVVIKPHVSVKFPWRLKLGNHVWIGERVWIDNLASVSVDDHSCLSQGAYLCTGSHDWSDRQFRLVIKPIAIGRGCWVGAFARLAPGCTLEDGAVLAMNAFCATRLAANTVQMSDGTQRERKIGVDERPRGG